MKDKDIIYDNLLLIINIGVSRQDMLNVVIVQRQSCQFGSHTSAENSSMLLLCLIFDSVCMVLVKYGMYFTIHVDNVVKKVGCHILIRVERGSGSIWKTT